MLPYNGFAFQNCKPGLSLVNWCVVISTIITKGQHNNQSGAPIVDHRWLCNCSLLMSDRNRIMGLRMLIPGKSHFWKAQWPIGPRTAGRGIAAHPRQTLLDNQSTSQADGRMKRRAAGGSPAPWRTCQNTGWESDGPRVQEIHKPAVGCGQWSADISVVFLVPIEAFALPGRT